MSKARRTVYRIPLYLSLVIFALDAIALTASSVLSNFYFPLFINGTAYHFKEQAFSYYLLFNIILLFNFAYKGHYRNRIPYWQQVRTIMKTIFAILVVTFLSYYIFKLEISLAYVTLNWTIAAVFLLLARSLSFRILRMSKNWTLPVTLLGDNQMVIDCMYAFCNDGQSGFRVDTIMLRDRIKKPICLDFIPAGHPPITHIDASGEYLDYILKHQDNFYIIDMEGLRGENRDNLIKLLETHDIDYAIAPPTKRLHLYGMDPLYFFGNDIMILHSRNRYREPLSLVLKRALDIVVSLAFLPLLGALALVIYVMKKRENVTTNMFYGGKRVGLNGKEFSCWKFNTMRPDADKILNDLLASDPEKKAEWDKYQKLADDPRIDGKISDILRKTSLDELPQLWNVFIGDMSLVGPRPILPFQREEYGDSLKLYESLRPGITGLWQVSGRNETTFEQRAYWDSWYIKNWSLWHDIVILLKTVSVLLTKRGAS